MGSNEFEIEGHNWMSQLLQRHSRAEAWAILDKRRPELSKGSAERRNGFIRGAEEALSIKIPYVGDRSPLREYLEGGGLNAGREE